MRYLFLRFPNGKPKAVTFSYDDGVTQDIRLAEIFDKYGLKATFNHMSDAFKGSRLLPKETIVEKFINKGHEIAVHGAFHKASGGVSYTSGIADVLDCRRELESKYGMIIRGMAYPDSGLAHRSTITEYEGVRDYLKKLGIAYARTTVNTYGAERFDLPTDWYKWNPTAHHNDKDIFETIEKFVSFDMPSATVTRRWPMLLYIWGHSYEFDNNNNWDRIEQICQGVSGKDDVWYATNIEIYEYIEAFNRLSFSADEKIVYNPTVKTLWMDVDGRLIKIEPNETIYL